MGISHLPQAFHKLLVPAIAAPMFIVSGPKLVVETCKNGMIGTFPALNNRSTEGYDQWLTEVEEALADAKKTNAHVAPFGVNLIVHKSNPRLQADLEVTVKHKVPLVITSLGAVSELVDAVHSYGGVVFHDVINNRHAQKAAAAGVDGLIPVCAGAGGHAGTLSPFALVAEIRQWYDKTICLSGALSTGRDIATARMLGADFGYLGSRFINTTESAAEHAYKQMIIDSAAKDVVYTKEISGVNANFLRPSIELAGLDPDNLAKKEKIDFGEELNAAKAWKNIWSAGQGVGSIKDIPTTAELVQRLAAEYVEASQQYADAEKERLALLRSRL